MINELDQLLNDIKLNINNSKWEEFKFNKISKSDLDVIINYANNNESYYYDKNKNTNKNKRNSLQRQYDIIKGSIAEYGWYETYKNEFNLSLPNENSELHKKMGTDGGVDIKLTTESGNIIKIDLKSIDWKDKKTNIHMIISKYLLSDFYILYYVKPNTGEYSYVGGLEVTKDFRLKKNNYLADQTKYPDKLWIPIFQLIDVMPRLKELAKN